MKARLPDFIIIGAMKCGTSSLHAQLASRAGIFMSTPKEPNFFSNDDQFARGLGWYASLFSSATESQLCGESSTHYTKLPTYPHTIMRLREHIPQAKLIYIMRDPLDRIVSQYIHEWTQREVSGSLESAIRKHPRFVAYSCYAHQVEPFLDAYGAQSVLPVFFERMLRYPDEALARVCGFIGDPGGSRWDFDLPQQNISRDRLRRSTTRDALLGLPGVRALKKQLPAALRARVQTIWQLRRRPQISAALRAEIEARIDEDLLRLGAWLGTELRCRDWSESVLRRPLDWVEARQTAL